MKKTLIFLLFCMTFVILVGCSGGGEEGSANVNQDVQTGTAPGGLDGAASTGADGAPSTTGGVSSGGGPATPSSTP